MLQQLTEFAFISKKYSSHILWQDWLIRGKEKGVATQFFTYLALAQHLMGMEPPAGLVPSYLSRLHAARIIAAGSYLLTYKSLPES